MPHRTARTIGKRVVPSLTAASGSWALGEVTAARRDGIWPVGADDPYFSSVSLLLPMDGANGSTTFTDESNNLLTVTANGDVAISTAQSKFGGASAFFDGTGDYLDLATAALSFSGDFTVEAWVYPLSNTTGAPFNGLDAIFTLNRAGAWNAQGSGLVLSLGGVHYGTTNSAYSGGSVPLSTWSHVAVSRSGASLKAFIDGQEKLAVSSTATFGNGTGNVPGIGIFDQFGGSNRFTLNGYIDDLRITAGVGGGRYTANFTPTNTPHPTF